MIPDAALAAEAAEAIDRAFTRPHPAYSGPRVSVSYNHSVRAEHNYVALDLHHRVANPVDERQVRRVWIRVPKDADTLHLRAALDRALALAIRTPCPMDLGPWRNQGGGDDYDDRTPPTHVARAETVVAAGIVVVDSVTREGHLPG